MPDRAVRAPERFRGGLPLRRPVTMCSPTALPTSERRSRGTGTLPHGVIGDVTLTPVSHVDRPREATGHENDPVPAAEQGHRQNVKAKATLS